MSSREAARMLRRIKDRQQELSEAISEGDETPNPIKEIVETLEIVDSVSLESDPAGDFTYDQDQYDDTKYVR